MPFTKEFKDLPEGPAVRIFLTGLLLIQPDTTGESCEIFVNRSAPDHELSIEVREKRDGIADSVLMRHFGPLAFLPPPDDPPSHGLFIIAKSPKGLGRYVGAPKPGADPLSFAIDLKDAQFHKNQDVTVDAQGGRPSILLNDGIFYTAEKTAAELTINLEKGGHALGTIQPFANLIGANLYMDGEEDVVQVRWRQNGLPEVLELKKPEKGTSYEIYIMNDPPFLDPEKAEIHDEFREYYKILPNVPTQEQFKLEVTAPPGFKGSAKKPCMPLYING